MRTLLIDNYDSFTYNLFQLLAEVNGVEPLVIRNDEASWDDLAALEWDAVVLSPGPGRPERPGDFGVCAEAIARCERPLLGVCLGHQGIGLACGAEVVSAPEPVHGRLSTVSHDGSPLFAGIPARFEAVRYHSLCLRRPLPDGLEEIAVADDGVAMAVARRDRPQWGVQFHPESVATEHGRRLLENFRRLAGAGEAAAPGRRVSAVPLTRPAPAATGAPVAGGVGWRLSWRSLSTAPAPEDAFTRLYGDAGSAFWLDGEGEFPGTRFSYMGDASGPLAAVLRYDVTARELRIESATGVEVRGESVLDHLRRRLAELGDVGAELPCEFRGGFVGYLGYELKAECGGEAAHVSPHPDAALLFADRLLAFDRAEGAVHLICLHGAGGEAEAKHWLDATEAALRGAGGNGGAAPETARSPGAAAGGSVAPRRSRREYLAAIDECQRLLREGETYEVCLTDALDGELRGDPLELYRRLRRANPAPHSAYLRIGGLALLSSSPERFLRVRAGGEVEAKPIKGTAARAADPAAEARAAAALRDDPKSRAENLMIADLLRNDLGRVCEVGSVEVPGLMEVETYATVHQLVTTVRGRLREGLGPVDAIRACFPPGSMTGAPKRRTMEILDRLEGRARGPYSGALGYLGAGGRCDLGVVIRTLVLDGTAASVGAGGAIVAQSDPEAELAEMLLKAEAVTGALDLVERGMADPKRTEPG